jgi:hypothetical protein
VSSEDWARYNSVINEFEQSYQKKMREENFSDSSERRVAFYAHCLVVIRGPMRHSKEVQRSLIQYYENKRDEEYKKISKAYK